MAQVLLEVCVESADAALAAQQGGADRIELCAGLGEGGTTPSAGLLAEVRERLNIGVVTLIRPRRGDFLYGEHDAAVMLRDVLAARAAGADGVAIGALRADGSIDVPLVSRLIAAARPLSVTFHRAIDMCRDPLGAVPLLVDLGVDRVLTSGGAADAHAGIPTIAAMVRAGGGRISIMPGGGIRADNLADIVLATGVREAHFSASQWHDSDMAYHNPACAMAGAPPASEYRQRFVDAAEVRRYRERLDAALSASGT